MGAVICYDMNLPEIVRDTVFKGAELVVRIQGELREAVWEGGRIGVSELRAGANLG